MPDSYDEQSYSRPGPRRAGGQESWREDVKPNPSEIGQGEDTGGHHIQILTSAIMALKMDKR